MQYKVKAQFNKNPWYNFNMKDIWDGIINIILSGFVLVYEKLLVIFRPKRHHHK